MTGDIKVVGGNADTVVAFKNVHPFIRAVIHLNDEHVDTAENLDLTMNLCNLIKYSNNYADTTTSLYHYKRPDQTKNNNVIASINITSSSFKYQLDLIEKQVTSEDVVQSRNPDGTNAYRLWENVKTIVPLKYIIIFFKS